MLSYNTHFLKLLIIYRTERLAIKVLESCKNRKMNFVEKLYKKNKVSCYALAFLVFLYVVAIFADFIAPYPYDVQFRQFPYHPPTPLHFFDKNGKFHLIPFVYGHKLVDPVSRTYETDYSRTYKLKFFVKGHPHYFLGIFKTNLHLFGVEKGGHIFLLGTDKLGRDIFSRLIYGTRVTLTVGLVGTIISFFIGTIVGAISGYFGGRTDAVIMRIVEVLMAFPSFYLMLALRSVFPIDMPSYLVFLAIVGILSFIGWAGFSRVIRSMVLSLREQDYVRYAKVLGASSFYIIRKHIIPFTYSYLITSATLSIPGYILGESALSLIGLGVQEPFPSWGNMLAEGSNVYILSSHPWLLAPGVAISAVIIAFNLLGDGLRDYFDIRV